MIQANEISGLYTDESPGLKVDPFVVMVLSIGFIISVVALHSKFSLIPRKLSTILTSRAVIAKFTKRFSS